MMELTSRMSRDLIIVRGKLIPYLFPLSTKDLRLVVSIQTKCTWNTSLPLNREVIFYPIKVFSLLSHDDSSFVGASDVSQISLLYDCMLWARPAKGQMLDVYQRPDYWVRPWHILRWRLTTSLPYRRTSGPNAGLHVPTYVLGIRQTDMSGSTWINRYSLWKSPPRALFGLVPSKSHKINFGAL